MGMLGGDGVVAWQQQKGAAGISFLCGAPRVLQPAKCIPCDQGLML